MKREQLESKVKARLMNRLISDLNQVAMDRAIDAESKANNMMQSMAQYQAYASSELERLHEVDSRLADTESKLKALQSEDEDAALEYWKKAQWDGETGFSHMGDCAYTWFVNAGHLYLADEDLDIGTPVVQPHGGKVLYNITEWSWK